MKSNDPRKSTRRAAWSIAGIGRCEKLVLMYLATHTTRTNRLIEDCSIREIAKACCCSPTTVSRSLARLEARRLVSAWKPSGRTNSYVLRFIKPRPMGKLNRSWERELKEGILIK